MLLELDMNLYILLAHYDFVNEKEVRVMISYLFHQQELIFHFEIILHNKINHIPNKFSVGLLIVN